MASIYKRGDIYWIKYYGLDGKPYRQSLKTKSRKTALAHKANFEKALCDGKFTASGGYTFQEISAQYLQFKKDRLAPKTYSTISTRLNRFSNLVGKKRITEFTSAIIDDTLDKIRQKQLDDGKRFKVNTRNDYLANIKAVFSWCVNRGILIANPAVEAKKVKSARAPRTWLTRQQRDKILELAKNLSPYHYPMIATALYAGPRYGELIRLEWQDFDWHHNLIRIRTKPHLDMWSPKTKKDRAVPMHPELKRILGPYRKKSGLCFPTPSGALYQTEPRPKVLSRLFDEIGLQGVKGLGFHTFRHTFASLLVQQGVSIYKVSNWLGHASIQTTMVYAHLAPKFDKEIARL